DLDALGRQRRWNRVRPDRQPDSVVPRGGTCILGEKAMKRNERGMTLLGFVIVLAVVGFFAYVAMRLFPMYQEYYSVRSAMKGLAAEPGIGTQDPARIQDLFFRRLYINYSENVKKEHVKLRRVDNGWEMNVQYEVRRPLVGNLDVVGKFQATQMLTRAGDVN